MYNIIQDQVLVKLILSKYVSTMSMIIINNLGPNDPNKD